MSDKSNSKYIKQDGHEMECFVCYDMLRRGYKKESKYWVDFFEKKLSPPKFRILAEVKPNHIKKITI